MFPSLSALTDTVDCGNSFALHGMFIFFFVMEQDQRVDKNGLGPNKGRGRESGLSIWLGHSFLKIQFQFSTANLLAQPNSPILSSASILLHVPGKQHFQRVRKFMLTPKASQFKHKWNNVLMICTVSPNLSGLISWVVCDI